MRYDEILRKAEDVYRETMSGNSSYMMKKRQDAPLFEDKNKSPSGQIKSNSQFKKMQTTSG